MKEYEYRLLFFFSIAVSNTKPISLKFGVINKLLSIIDCVWSVYIDLSRLSNTREYFVVYFVPMSQAINFLIVSVGIIYHNVVCPLITNVGIPINAHALSKLHHHEFPSSIFASVL
jgi:hypothetical protein